VKIHSVKYRAIIQDVGYRVNFKIFPANHLTAAKTPSSQQIAWLILAN